MEARVIEKFIEVEGRRFCVRKYDAFTSIKISKLLIAKVLPMVKSFLPLVTEYLKLTREGSTESRDALNELISQPEDLLSFEGIAQALDLVTGSDLDYIMKQSLMQCTEPLAAGASPVMRADGTYGVPDVEYDPLLTLRLVCEAILWGLADFFTANRLTSVLTPLSASLPLNQPT